MESVRWMIELAVRAGVQRIVLNGSFVTDIIEPNDVDCVLLVAPAAIADKEAMNELEVIISYLDISLFDQDVLRDASLDPEQFYVTLPLKDVKIAGLFNDDVYNAYVAESEKPEDPV